MEDPRVSFLYDEIPSVRKKHEHIKIVMMIFFFLALVLFISVNFYYTIKLTRDIEKIGNYVGFLFSDANKTEVRQTFREVKALIDYACDAINCENLMERG